MKSTVWSLLLLFVCSASAQVPTTFTYQGRLTDNGEPANGNYDLRFVVYDSAASGNSAAGPLTNAPVIVSDGLFTVALDFGTSVFTGADRWLEMAVRTNGSTGPFTILAPRQHITSSPYAIQAASVSSVPAANITGTIPDAQLSANIARLIVPNTATQAAGVPIVTSGFITGANVTRGGAGYITPPAVSISDTTGSGAVVTANISGGMVISFTVQNPGTGYSSATTLTVAPPPSNAYQVFASPTYFSSPSYLTNALNVFSGNGAGVTNVNLASINSDGAITLRPTAAFTQSTLNVGDFPRSVAPADVNGDGNIDLISANNAANTLSILVNDGRGNFTLSSSPGVGPGPQSVAAADVNGDGSVDLISANANNNTLSVLTNDGAGAFMLSSSPAVGVNPYSVAAADVNGDNRIDLISGNFGGASLTVLTNNRNGVFTSAATLTVGMGPHHVTAADLNSDGHIDLVSVATFMDALTVLTNNGRGVFTFSFSVPLSAGAYPLWVAAADVNDDGRNDLVSANFGLGSISVLTNYGASGFLLASSPSTGGAGPHSIAMADLTGDRRVDLICANQGSASLSVMTNGGNGRFALHSTLQVGNGPTSLTAADLNGDGLNDFASADQGDDILSLLIQNPFNFTGSFSGNFGGSFGGNFSGRFTGDGNALTVNASNVISGTLPDARLSANVARRSGGNTLNGDQIIIGDVSINTGSPANGVLDVDTGAGRVTFLPDSVTPGMTMTGGAVPGVLRFRNIFEIWPNTARTAAGRLDVRQTNGNATITLNGANGQVTATTFTPSSDRNAKENFAPVNSSEILEKVAALPISRWNFKADAATPHIGPTAQDFHSAFRLGSDDKRIATVDADGVALAAIQGLNQKIEEQHAELERKQKEISDLKRRLERLEKLFSAPIKVAR